MHNDDPPGTQTTQSTTHALRYGESSVTGPGAGGGLTLIDFVHDGVPTSGFNSRTMQVQEAITGLVVRNLRSTGANDRPIVFANDVTRAELSGYVDMSNIGGANDPTIEFNGNMVQVRVGLDIDGLRNMVCQVKAAADGPLDLRTCVFSTSGAGPGPTGELVEVDSAITLAWARVHGCDLSSWKASGSMFGGAGTITDGEAWMNRLSGGGYDASSFPS